MNNQISESIEFTNWYFRHTRESSSYAKIHAFRTYHDDIFANRTHHMGMVKKIIVCRFMAFLQYITKLEISMKPLFIPYDIVSGPGRKLYIIKERHGDSEYWAHQRECPYLVSINTDGMELFFRKSPRKCIIK